MSVAVYECCSVSHLTVRVLLFLSENVMAGPVELLKCGPSMLLLPVQWLFPALGHINAGRVARTNVFEDMFRVVMMMMMAIMMMMMMMMMMTMMLMMLMMIVLSSSR